MAIVKTKAGTFRVDYRDKAGRRYRKTFATQKAAREYDRVVKGDITRNEFIAPSDITVTDAANEWWQKKVNSGGYRPASLKNWRLHIDNYIAPLLGDFKIQEVRIKHVEDSAVAWAQKTSAYTSGCVLTTLRAIFKFAERREWIRQNVALRAERVKVSNDEDADDAVLPEMVYSEAELKALINTTESASIDRLMVMVPVLTGLRIGEVLGLQWPSIDLKANLLSVRTALIDATGGRQIAKPKSKSSRRTLPLPAELAHELRQWRLKNMPSEQGLVFATLDGHPLHRRYAMQVLDRAITAAGIKRLTLHKLRHTFASLLLSRGVPITTVSAYLGHRDSVITLRVYAHFVKNSKANSKANHMQKLASSILK